MVQAVSGGPGRRPGGGEGGVGEEAPPPQTQTSEVGAVVHIFLFT